MATDAQRRARDRWNAAHMATKYSRVVALIPADAMDTVRAAASSEGVSLSMLLQLALLDRLGLDAWPGHPAE